MVEIIFWVCFVVLFYTFIGYGLLIATYNFLFRRVTMHPNSPFNLPEVSLIIPAFNEGRFLKQKIKNCRQLKYPEGKLHILFITDGSIDDSNQLLQDANIPFLFKAERKGKVAAMNRAMSFVKTEIVIFSDANSWLNAEAIINIVQHYSDPLTGGVAGEKKIDFNFKDGGVGVGEGIYWRYESWLKQLDSNFNTVVGAAGELFSIRHNLYHPPREDSILDDFMLSMSVCQAGYKVVYEPNAFALEAPSINLHEEKKRRIRISAGCFQALSRLGAMFNIYKHPILSFQYLSRRVFRWVLNPLCIVIIFITNAYLVINENNWIYMIFLMLQTLMYASAFTGWLLYKTGYKLSIFFVPFYFLFMNICLVQGFIRYVSGNHSVLWDKSARQMLHEPSA